MISLEPQEYYFIEDAANIFNCTIQYIIHMGVNGKIRLATNVSMCGKKYKAEPYDTSDIKVFYDGIYYIHKKDLQQLELDKNLDSIYIDKVYPVETEKQNCGRYLHPLPSDYINDKPLEYVYFEYNIKVSKSELVVFHDDMTKLFPKESPVQRESPISSSRKENPKANESLMKMVIAMAIKGYGFNPNDKKSSTPAEIEADVQQLGLSIDVDTVRKWLKEALTLLSRAEKED